MTETTKAPGQGGQVGTVAQTATIVTQAAGKHRRRPAGVSIGDWLRARSIWNGSCLRWQGAHVPRGYGQLRDDNGRVRHVHQLAYEAWVGPIPEGYDVDHVRMLGCRFRDCVSPNHLEAVPHAVNVRRTHDHLVRMVQSDLWGSA